MVSAGGGGEVQGGEESSRFPLARIDSFVLFGQVSVSPFLVQRCGEDGRPIAWMTRTRACVNSLSLLAASRRIFN